MVMSSQHVGGKYEILHFICVTDMHSFRMSVFRATNSPHEGVVHLVRNASPTKSTCVCKGWLTIVVSSAGHLRWSTGDLYT